MTATHYLFFWFPAGAAPQPTPPPAAEVFGWITGGGRKEWIDQWLDRQRRIDKAIAEGPTFAEHLAQLEKQAAQVKAVAEKAAENAELAEAVRQIKAQDAEETEDMIVILSLTH